MWELNKCTVKYVALITIDTVNNDTYPALRYVVLLLTTYVNTPISEYNV